MNKHERWGAVLGYGVISSLGIGSASFAEAIFSGKSGIAPLSFPQMDDRLRVKIAAQVRGFIPEDHFSQQKLPLLDPFSQYALVAAREAVAHAKIDPDLLKGPKTGVILGTGVGGITTQGEGYQQFHKPGNRRGDPMTIPKMMANASASHISMEFGITGPAFVVASACASSNHAISLALQLLRAGIVDRVLTGGSEATITPECMRYWELMRVLSPEPCAPFSLGRMGMVIGEGGGILLLERADLTQKRRGEPKAFLCGAGMSSDAGDLLRPDPQEAGRAVREALLDAEVAPTDITYINAHGTGTLTNDQVETKVVHQVFGEHARSLAISSTKSMHGHALGAAGALEAVATVMALEKGEMPPTINWKPGDSICDLDYVPNVSRRRKITWALSHSFAFGGLNAVLCFRAK